MIKVSDIDRFNQKYKIDGKTGCWLWTASKLNGIYGAFWYLGKPTYAHRFSYTHYVRKIPASLLVCHHCDNPLCVNPEHLYTGTQKQNVHDCVIRRRRAIVKGENNPGSKLTINQIKAIRADGRTQAAIGIEYGISQAHVSAIKIGIKWGWLK